MLGPLLALVSAPLASAQRLTACEIPNAKRGSWNPGPNPEAILAENPPWDLVE